MKRAIVLAAAATALAMSGCGGLSWPEAFEIEMKQCERKHAGDAEAIRQCQAIASKKYDKYFSEGEYPSETDAQGLR